VSILLSIFPIAISKKRNEYEKYEKEVFGQDNKMEENEEPIIDIEKPIIKQQEKEKILVQGIHDLTQKILIIGWRDFLEAALEKVLEAVIEQKMMQCKGIFTRQLVIKGEEWLEQIIINWLQWIYWGQSDTISQWREKLLTFLRQTYARIRNTEMLEIIGVYPDTNACIIDIKHCLAHTSEYNDFAKNVRNQISKRLLIPGIVTPLIIDQYIQTIRVMKLLDPSALLLGIF